MSKFSKKHLALALGTGVLIGGASLGAYGVSAQGFGTGNGTGDQLRADDLRDEVLGLSRDQVADMRDDGMSFEEILAEQGFASSDEFHTAMDTKVRETLAERGFSQAEIDSRIAQMDERYSVREDVRDTRLELLGLSEDELHTMHDDGKSFEDVVKDAGYSDVDAFTQALKDKLTEKWLADGVSQGTIDLRLNHIGQFHKGEARQMRGPGGPLGPGMDHHEGI